MAKKPNFSPSFISSSKLNIVPSYHSMQNKRKLMNKPQENGKRPSFGTHFGLFGPNVGPQFFFQVLYFY